jgi:hypothetical protein
MKPGFYKPILIAVVIIPMIAACDYDNYEPPSSKLTGQVVYQNNPVGLRNNTVELELWQHGYDDFEKIPVYVAQDGSFSAVLFNGDYKLVLRNGNGPWLNVTDSIDVSVRGNTTVDVPVLPYYTIGSEDFSKNGTTVESTVTIAQANGTNPIEYVSLLVSTTNIVDEINNIQRINVPGAGLNVSQPVVINLPLNTRLAERSYVFARVGIKITGVAEMVYTPVQKIE